MIESTPLPIPTSPAEDAAPAAEAPRSGRKRVVSLIKLALTLIVVYYVTRALIEQFRAVSWTTCT
jgi:hypothetical protein